VLLKVEGHGAELARQVFVLFKFCKVCDHLVPNRTAVFFAAPLNQGSHEGEGSGEHDFDVAQDEFGGGARF
jgi:hypothetical protein